MTALISKPGITSASTLSIPKEWDKAWFRSFIQAQLKGADVRNAVGVNGIVVSGNIASPYATIGFGPGPITIQAGSSSPTLTVLVSAGGISISAPSASSTALFSQNATISSSGGDYPYFGYNMRATSSTGVYNYQVSDFASGVQFPTGGFAFRTAPSGTAGNPMTLTTMMQIAQTGGITGRGPISNSLIDMTPDAGTFTLTGTGFTAAVTSTATFFRIGRLVALNVGNGMQGTSNATTFTMTGLPASLQPFSIGAASQTIVLSNLENSGAAIVGSFSVANASGTITMSTAPNAGNPWTASGTKGFFNSGGSTLFYML